MDEEEQKAEIKAAMDEFVKDYLPRLMNAVADIEIVKQQIETQKQLISALEHLTKAIEKKQL